MRTTKEITITDNGNEYKYRLTKLSALSLIRWGERVLCVLAKAGILDRQAETVTDGMAFLANLVTTKGLTFLGDIDCDRVDELILDLIEQTATRTVGNATIKVNKQDIDNTLEDITSFFNLAKECFLINFHQFAPENLYISPQSPVTETTTTKRGISVQKSAH